VKGVSGESFQPVDNIKKGFYPYADSQTGVSIPKYAPAITTLPARMQNMFRLAFVASPALKKPSAGEWREALLELQGRLTTCEFIPAHMYYESRAICPWCQVNAQMTALVKQARLTHAVNQTSKRPDPFSQPVPPGYFGPPPQGTIQLPIRGFAPVTKRVLITGVVYGVVLGIAGFLITSAFLAFWNVFFIWRLIGALAIGAMSCWAVLSNGSEYSNKAGAKEFLDFLRQAGSYALGGAGRGLIAFAICLFILALPSFTNTRARW
jgi:hypothetical protein